MNGHQIDELLKRKVDNARRTRTLRTAAALLALLALIVLIGTAVHLHKAKAVNAPDVPSTADTEPEPDESEEPGESGTPEVSTQTKDGKKPLQPEEIRRLQIKHELVLEWENVPEEEQPPLVTVTVLHQGEEAARFTLTAENEWRHSWSDSFSANALTLRAELPKSVMASFALRGNQFTLYASGSGPAVSASEGGEEAPEDGEEAPEDDEEAPEDDEEAPKDGEEAPEDGEEAPEDDEKAPEDAEAAAQSGSIDAPAGETPEDEEADESDGSADAPEAGHSWWPIVILMICGAALVILGVFGSDRRRTR